tara:strand:- start:6851 stop:7951 length:1101 start_codon:yes stop_codon:yes gene_type:complete
MMKRRFLISGGGTGGHIFPALAIAKEIERRYPHCVLLFVGASDRMEMDKIPAAGYSIKGLWISGFQRSFSLKNFLFPIKLIFSVLRSFFIVLRFNPDVVIGTGGYASGPVLWVASLLRIPTLIQEQNSYPGITNKILSSKVSKVCVAYLGLDRFFTKEKLHITGNPIRAEIEFGVYNRDEVLSSYGLVKEKPLVLVVGGSLGAKRINETVLENISWFKENDVQLIWQTGMLYYDRCKAAQMDLGQSGKIQAFITEMGPVLAAADVVVSRAGAIALSEFCSLGKACILVPSPNVAEDHQKKNAQALSENDAAILVEEKNIDTELFEAVNGLVKDVEMQKKLGANCKKMDKPKAAERIVDIIEELIHD